MWADAQRDGHPTKYRWRPLQKFRNSIPCTMPQSLADGRCSRLGRKVNFAAGKIPLGGKSPQNVYIVYQPRRWPNILQSFIYLR